MFDFEETFRKLRKLEDVPGKGKRYIVDTLTDKSFLNWVYCPDPEPSARAQCAKDFTELQNVLITSRWMRRISDGLEDHDYACDRAVSTFLNALCSAAVDAYNRQEELLSADRKNGRISNSDVREMREKLDTYRTDVEDLAKTAKKIVRRRVKNLSRDTGFDKSICRLGYWYVPGPDYLAKNRIGVFLRELLSAIYDEVATNGYFPVRHNPKWRIYFAEIFGAKNVASVATFILLEGANNLDRYSGSAQKNNVRECWDSLTEFALSELNDAPEELRNQMIELYLKRVDRQFRNRSMDLRVDLLQLPHEFSRLSKTVARYAERLTDIMNRAKKGARVDES